MVSEVPAPTSMSAGRIVWISLVTAMFPGFGHSNDSRYWGVVPTDDIIGRAVGIYWPLGRLRNF